MRSKILFLIMKEYTMSHANFLFPSLNWYYSKYRFQNTDFCKGCISKIFSYLTTDFEIIWYISNSVKHYRKKMYDTIFSNLKWDYSTLFHIYAYISLMKRKKNLNQNSKNLSCVHFKLSVLMNISKNNNKKNLP